MSNAPIGVFDSGLGGLTCVKELVSLLPSENIVYFGDTARVPYGTRSRDNILTYSKQDIAFLYSKNVKAIISACGTVSSVAGSMISQSCPLPYIEVISPTARAAVKATKNKRVGVIATKATLHSGKFTEEIAQLDSSITVYPKTCPLFVPLVEEGHFSPDDKLVQQVVEMYLKELVPYDIDTLILGCTHYPILADAISAYMGTGVTLINSGREAALAAATSLGSNNLLNTEDNTPSHSFFVTDTADSFHTLAQIFLGDNIQGTVEKISPEQLEHYTSPIG